VVVIGYGTIKKSDLTGAVSSVKKEELTRRATSNAAEAIQGKIAGVNIQRTGGNAGAGIQVKIRGVNTMGGNDPLYIIDGFPGSINSVNPSDIESLEVLKDGAAAAIYGSIAANGVVIITTKKAKEGNVVVDFNSYLSFTQVSNQLDLLNAKEYVQVHKQMFKNAGKKNPGYVVTPPDVNTDWQDAIFRNGLAQNYSLSASGGQSNLKFAISANYNKEKGVIIGNDVENKNTRIKINFKKSIFEVDASMYYKASRDEQPKFSIKEAYMTSPLVPIYDENEEYGFGLTNKLSIPKSRNVMADDHYKSKYTDGQNFSGNVSVGINIMEGLQFKSSYSYKGNNYENFYHAPRYIARPNQNNEYPLNGDSRTFWQEQLLDNILSYNKQIGKHSLNAMVGTSMTKTISNWNSVSVEGKTSIYYVDDQGNIQAYTQPSGFLNENFPTIDAGANGGTFDGSGSNYEYNRLSFFGRLNYSYASKYLIQATFRRDGSSKFGANNRWATFPSVALGWKISEEEFFPKTSVLNNLKLRASYGRLGNENAIGYYGSVPYITSGNNLYYGYVQGIGSNPWIGSIAATLYNPDLKWETTESVNIGLDFGLFSNKLTGGINYFQKNTKDLLILRLAPLSSGLDDQVKNIGEIQNKGVEFELNYTGAKNGFTYNIGANLSYLQNNVEKLPIKDQVIPSEGLLYGDEHFPARTVVGKSVASFFLYRTNGLFQSIDEVNGYKNSKGELLQPYAKAGDIRFKDINGDGAIDEKDKEFCGSGVPKLEANINFSGAYKGIDMSFVIGSGWGHKLYNGNKFLYEGMASGSNFLTSTLNAWTPTNTNTNVPRAIFGDPNQNTRESDRFLEDGDFIRLRQIQIGYTLPKPILAKLGVTNIRIYASGENLFTWSKYSGIDPEFGRDNVLNTGIDNLIYPFTRSYICGLQFSF
jgi:TonB-linked SusC/RagA family outer membrane protein